MSTTKPRDRVSLSITPRLASILDRHAHAGEARAATAARLIEQADAITNVQAPMTGRFMIFPDVPGHVVTTEMVEAALDE